MKALDVNELERTARNADQDEWQWRPGEPDVLEGKHDGQIVLFPDPEDERIVLSAANRAHIAAASPPVVLALIARIRELESAGQVAVGEQHCDATDECHRAAHAHLAAVIARGTVLP